MKAVQRFLTLKVNSTTLGFGAGIGRGLGIGLGPVLPCIMWTYCLWHWIKKWRLSASLQMIFLNCFLFLFLLITMTSSTLVGVGPYLDQWIHRVPMINIYFLYCQGSNLVITLPPALVFVVDSEYYQSCIVSMKKIPQVGTTGEVHHPTWLHRPNTH